MQMQPAGKGDMERLTVGYIQFDVESGEISANMEKVARELEIFSAPGPTLFVLPELWATGFDYPRIGQLAAETPAVLQYLQKLCHRHNCWLAGSLPEQAAKDGKVYNTLYVTGPEGVSGSYRKQQLFAPMLENRYFAPGSSPSPIPSGFGLLAALICYDLRFGELAGRLCAGGARLLLVSAQWPMARLSHWRTLLQARAIENQIHVVACNRCGTTGDTLFAGHSAIVAPDGTVLSEAQEGLASASVTVEMAKQEAIRSSFRTVGRSPYRHDDKDKIVSIEQAGNIVDRNRALGRRTVFTNGCFDILHAGHVVYLEQARKQGDCLIVGLNSDSSIKAIKGPDRPVNNGQDRARVLAALGCVDNVVVFEEETPLALIKALLPDVLVKGADWAEEDIVGGKEVKEAGGRVVRVPLVEGSSTTRVIKRMQNR